jgi:hypothetical protein
MDVRAFRVFSAILLSFLLPISPCDGKVMYSWDRLVWSVFFIPLMLLYFVVNL